MEERVARLGPYRPRRFGPKQGHPLACRALLILSNVDREANRVGKGSSYGQVHFITQRPSEPLWRRAWAQALLMNVREVLPLLGRLHQIRSTPSGVPVELRLLCPAAWKGWCRGIWISASQRPVRCACFFQRLADLEITTRTSRDCIKWM